MQIEGFIEHRALGSADENLVDEDAALGMQELE